MVTVLSCGNADGDCRVICKLSRLSYSTQIGGNKSTSHHVFEINLSDDQAFGVASNSAHPAKEIIFPVLEEQPDGIEDVYKRSHGAIGPGEQISRGYDWHGANMSSHIFGLKGNSIAYNGISSSVAEALKGDSYSAQSSSIARKMVRTILMKNDLDTIEKNALACQLANHLHAV